MNLKSMSYVGGSEYKLIESDKVKKKKLVYGQSWKRCLLSNFFTLNCDELFSYTKQEYFWPRSSHLNYFGEPYIPPLREALFVEQHIFLEQNIEIYEEVHEDLIIEEEPNIEIVDEINEDLIIDSDCFVIFPIINVFFKPTTIQQEKN